MRGRKGAFSFNLYSARLGSLLALGLSGRSVSSGSLGGLLGILHVRGPEGKVVTEELHDEGRVLVALLGEGVELGDGVVEGLLGEVASAVGAVQDLVVEDREVEGKTQADGVGGGQLGDGNVRSSLVSLERLVGGVLALVASGELGEVTVVVTLHLVVEDLGLARLGGLDEVLVQDVQDVIADLGELVATRPGGSVTTELAWSNLNDDGFERLIFSLISNEPGYENPEWLMRTRAADRGRDLSVTRVTADGLSGTRRQRVVIQCKHWLSKSVALIDVSGARDQMALWPNPPVDVLVIATSGRFTSDAVAWIEQHNQAGVRPQIEMWAESHLERVLASRPALIAEAKLR